MSFVEPSFEIDEKGRVICQYHTNYSFFMMPNKTLMQEKQMEILLTCKTCKHYINNDCYFPRKEIDKIEVDRLKKHVFTCRFCGNLIDRMLTVIQKLYFKQRFNIEIPLICCSCYESLKSHKLIKDLKVKSNRIKINLIISILGIIFMYLTRNFFLSIPAIYVSIWFLIALSVFSFLIQYFASLSRLNSMRKGKKFFKEYFSKNDKKK
jgi:hypothetical protein